MRKLLTIFSLFLFLAVPLKAEEGGVKIQLTRTENLEVSPGQVLTLVFLVTNHTSEARELVSQVELPEGWDLITGDALFTLEADTSDVRLLSLGVPSTALAGMYELNYQVSDSKAPSVGDSWNVPVSVRSLVRLDVRSLHLPDSVIAGEVYKAAFIVSNLGNVRVTARIEAVSGQDLPLSIDPEETSLAPSESRRVIVSVQTDAKMTYPFRHRLTIRAQAAEAGEISTRTTSYVQVIPRVTQVDDRFHRIPFQATLLGLTSRTGNGIRSGLQMELSGSGSLDEGKTQRVELSLGTPDQRTQSIYGQPDEYRFNLETDRYTIGLGDNSYYLSFLTGGVHDGRGIQGNLNLRGIDLGMFYQTGRGVTTGLRELAGYLDYTLPGGHTVGINLLRQGTARQASHIVSLHGEFEPMKQNYVELEYASGEGDDAYFLHARGQYTRVNYSLDYVRAGERYPAYFRDTDRLSANLAVEASDVLGLRANFRQTRNNLGLDPNRTLARVVRYAQYGLNYRFMHGGLLSLEHRSRISRDRFPQPSFHVEESGYVISARYTLPKLTLNASYEFSTSADHRTGSRAHLRSASFTGYFAPARRQSYNIYVQYGNRYNCPGSAEEDPFDAYALFQGDMQRSITVGLNSTLQLRERTHLWLQLQGHSFQYAGVRLNRISLEGQLTHALANRHQISVSGRYARAGSWTTNDIALEYSVPFGLPVARKRGIGSVSGHVYHEESGRPIPNVLVQLGSLTAVTDAAGLFKFPSVGRGTHQLSMNPARIELGLVATQKLPIEVRVEEHQQSEVAIGVVQGAALSGQVMQHRFADQSGLSLDREAASRLVPAHGLANVIVELRSDGEVKRRVTDTEGRFRFEELRPGRWTLKVYGHGLPQYHYLEKDSFEFTLGAEDEAEVTVNVLPKKRRILMLEEGGLIAE